MMNPTSDSLIWNWAWQNRWLIQQHSFWEICNGHSTIFWEDSWKQLPAMQVDWRLLPLKQFLQVTHDPLVRDYWSPAPENWDWNTRHIDLDHLPLQNRSLLSTLTQLLHLWKIKISPQSSKLRWGYCPAGRFSLKEAYHLVAHHSDLPAEAIWN